MNYACLLDFLVLVVVTATCTFGLLFALILGVLGVLAGEAVGVPVGGTVGVAVGGATVATGESSSLRQNAGIPLGPSRLVINDRSRRAASSRTTSSCR